MDILRPKLKLAAFLIRPLLIPISMSIHENTGYDALSSSPIDFAKKIKTPAIFLVAEKDNVSPPEKVQKMFNKYGSEKKKLHLMMGREHADCRLDEDLDAAIKYLRHLYQIYTLDQQELNKSKILKSVPSLVQQEKRKPDESLNIP